MYGFVIMNLDKYISTIKKKYILIGTEDYVAYRCNCFKKWNGVIVWKHIGDGINIVYHMNSYRNIVEISGCPDSGDTIDKEILLEIIRKKILKKEIDKLINS